MSIDEAIKDCEEIILAAEMMKQAEVYKYNKQLVEWLRELKAWREGKIVQFATDNTETIIFNTDI